MSSSYCPRPKPIPSGSTGPIIPTSRPQYSSAGDPRRQAKPAALPAIPPPVLAPIPVKPVTLTPGRSEAGKGVIIGEKRGREQASPSPPPTRRRTAVEDVQSEIRQPTPTHLSLGVDVAESAANPTVSTPLPIAPIKADPEPAVVKDELDRPATPPLPESRPETPPLPVSRPATPPLPIARPVGPRLPSIEISATLASATAALNAAASESAQKSAACSVEESLSGDKDRALATLIHSRLRHLREGMERRGWKLYIGHQEGMEVIRRTAVSLPSQPPNSGRMQILN